MNFAYASANFAHKSVGADVVTVSGISLGGAGAANYSLSNSTDVTLANITAKPLIASFLTTTRAYDGTLVAAVTGNSSDLVVGDSVSFGSTSATFGTANAHTGNVNVVGVSLSGADAGNYSLQNTSATSTGTITPKLLTVIGGLAADKNFDGNTSVKFTPGVLSGLVGNESLNLSSSAVFANSNVGTNKDVLVIYNIADGSGMVSNYKFDGASPWQLNSTLHASIKGNKPFVNPADNKVKPAQPVESGTKSHVTVASNETSIVKVAESSKQTTDVSMTQCVPTALTGVSLCFLSSE